MSGELRKNLVDHLTRRGGFDVYAQERGYQNAAQLETALLVASRIASGEFFSRGDVAALAQVYPALPASALHAAQAQVNRHASASERATAFKAAMGFEGFDPATLTDLVHHTHVADFSLAIEEKRAGEDTRAAREAAVSVTPNHVSKFNDDVRERRAEISRALAADDPAPPRDYTETKHRLADEIEARVLRRESRQEEEKFEGRAISREESIGHAFDAHSDIERSQDLLDNADLAPIFDSAMGNTE